MKDKKTNEISSSASNNYWDDPVNMIYETVSCLHKRGYEKIRIMSYISPSGCYFRCVISVKENFDETGFVCVEDESYPIFNYTTGSGFDFFGDGKSYEKKTVEELADKLLKKYPELAKLGKGKDSEYLLWYENVLSVVREKNYPYAFADYGYDIYGAKKIKLVNGDWIEYAPPGPHKKMWG